jgi:hypothetical protein
VVNWFRGAQRFFSGCDLVGFWVAIVWNYRAVGKPLRAAVAGWKDRREH